MPVFNDSEAIQLLPPCDAMFTVVGFEIGISRGAKTRGSEQYDLTLELDTQDGQRGRAKEFLIDHPSCGWKLDCFLKSAGVNLTKGQSFTFNRAESSATVPWIDPMGLRGWVKVSVEKFTRNDGSSGESNRIAVFYTDREKLPRVVTEKDEEPF